MNRKKLLQLAQGPKTAYPHNKSVVEVFEEIVNQYPDHTALRFKGRSMTYQELNHKANQLARHLRKLGVKKQDFVGIYLERSIDLFVGILAILKAGGIYVPIDASYPMERKLYMIDDTKLKILITSKSFVGQFPKGKLKLVLLDDIKLSDSPANLNLKIGPMDLAFVNYTSGTTGNPKGVQIYHQAINRLVIKPNWIFFAPDDRFLQISNISFDVLAHELWGALLNGATLCIYPQITLSSDELGKFITQEKITQIAFTARIFNVMVDEALESLKKVRYICSVGDVMSAKHAKIAFENLPSCHLINACGHTENTTYTTAYAITNTKEIEKEVPIGHPIGNTTAYILDEKRNLVPFGQPGELYTGGDGVAKGYLNRKKLTDEKFVPNPFGKGKLYRTGDLVRYLPDGNMSYLGRIDTQVKIRGFRIELSEIEEVMRKSPGVSDCIVIAREDIPGEKELVAYVESKEKKQITQEQLRKWVSSRLPAYMIPSFFVVLEVLPMTPNGKVDRKALPAPAKEVATKQSNLKTETEKTIGEIWSSLLHRAVVDRNAHFFKIGGHSILAMQLNSKVRKEFNIDIPVSVIFENSTLEKYALCIDQALGKGPKKIAARKPFAEWRKKEAVLDRTIQSKGLPAPLTSQYTRSKKIFLTGATGFVGAFFLKELLGTTQAKVYCLVRADSEKEALERLIKTLKTYLIWKPSYKNRIVPLAGYLEKPLLGLGASLFRQLADEIDSVFHIGAFVNNVLSYEQHKPANVLGTQEVIRLASTSRLKPLQFISTVDVVDGIKKMPIAEDVNIEKIKKVTNGYVESKWVAEKVILIARSRGIPCNIFRLPRVSGDTKNGAGPTGDFLWRMVQVCLKLKMVPRTDLSDDLTPVDYICRAIHIISTQPESINAQYHVVTPYPLSYSKVFEFLARLKYHLKKVDFLTWRQALLNQSETGDAGLQALASLLADTDFSKPLSRLTFATDHLKAALKSSHLKCPKIDQKLFNKYLKYYVEMGFLPSLKQFHSK